MLQGGICLILEHCDVLEKPVWVLCYKVIVRVVQILYFPPPTHPPQTFMQDHLKSQVMQQTHRVFRNVVGNQVVSSKILKHCICCMWIFFLAAVCVLRESKSGCWWTLTVSVMVIVCQSLGGASQQAMCLCVCLCV